MGIVAELEQLLSDVTARIEPSKKERRDVRLFVKSLLGRLDDELVQIGIEGSAQIHGSIAKDTWLSGERDLDVFIVLKKRGDKPALFNALNAAKNVAGGSWAEAYAEHPYIKAVIEGFDIDFVPCFELTPGGELASATDRTPLHTVYVRNRLDSGLKRDIRLLKKFMHGIGCYGAELRIGGFSGYLCELLVIGYGSFLNVLAVLNKERKPLVLDIENQYAGNQPECRKRFSNDPLIVVDPVDRGRNVASPVRESVFWESVAASRRFLSSPGQAFFFPSPTKSLDLNALEEVAEKKGGELLLVSFTLRERFVADVLWGQLNRAEKAVTNLLEKNDFTVLRSAAWSDERFNHVLAFKLEQGVLPMTRLRHGPPVSMIEMSERFLGSCLESEKAVSGPWIAGDCWWVEVKREHRVAAELLLHNLSLDKGASVGIPKGIREALHAFAVSPQGDVVRMNGNNLGFRIFLTDFLAGRPKWLLA